MKKKQTHDLPTVVADRIQEEFTECEGNLLPSYTELARRYAVSLSTVVRAASILETRGYVRRHRGRRMEKTGGTTIRPLPEVLSSREKLCRELKQGINNGTYPTGRPLPKLAYLAALYRVSEHTVVNAFRSLEEDGLVYKEGRTWRVGTSSSRSILGGNRSGGVILILLEKAVAWRGIFLNRRTEGFFRSFRAECDRHRVVLLPVVAREDAGSPTMRIAGKNAVLRAGRELGTALKGVLVAVAPSRLTDFPEWMHALCRLNRPVIRFDAHDRPLKGFSAPGNYYRGYSSEKNTAECAIMHVVDMGHTKMGYGLPANCDWAAKRFQFLNGFLSRECPEMKLKAFEYSVPTGTASESQILRTSLERLAVSRYRPIRDMWNGVVRDLIGRKLITGRDDALEYCIHSITHGKGLVQSEYHSLRSVIRCNSLLERVAGDTSVTAILAPSDDYAVDYYVWLSLTGNLSHISLLSFDNRWLPHPYSLPITTVDFGFDSLGFRAFHVILGDIPVSQSPGNTIVAEPRVVVRTSMKQIR